MKIKREYASKLYWGVFFFLMFLKYCYYKFQYFPVMDDWIQYGTYSLSTNQFNEIILKTLMYTIRPLANLSDIYIIGLFWDNMEVVFFFITAMHAASAYYLSRIFKYNGIKTGYIFLIIYGLLPFGTEATYWISASSRLVVGTFFTTLAIFYMCRYIFESQKRKDLAIFFIFQLISLGYYEPVSILAFVGCALIILPKLKSTFAKEAGLATIINYSIIACYYGYFSLSGQMMTRAEGLNSTAPLDNQKTLEHIIEMFSNADIYFYIKGLRRGTDLIINNQSYFFVAMIFVSFILVTVISMFHRRERNIFQNLKKILLGIILFWAPLIVFFVISSTWVSFRNAFTSFIGLGLIIEALLDISMWNGFMRRIRAFGTAIVVVCFIIINVSEITDYKSVSEADYKICSSIIEAGKLNGFLKEGLLLNVSNSYTELNREYHEHISSVTKSDWALTGTVRGVAKDITIKKISPVEVNKPFKLNSENISDYILYGIEDDLKVSLLTAEKAGNDRYNFYRSNGELYGEIEYRWGYVFFGKK